MLLSLSLCLLGCNSQGNNKTVENDSSTEQSIKLIDNELIITNDGDRQIFSFDFTVMYRNSDPQMALKPSSIKNVKYNIPTWLAIEENLADLQVVKRNETQSGDGFDDRILNASNEARSNNYFASAEVFNVSSKRVVQQDQFLLIEFTDHELFHLSAKVDLSASPYPSLEFEIKPKKAGYFSVGYNGAPSITLKEADEIWQPLIWQEKRFPDNAYLTLAFRATLPTTLYRKGNTNIGVLAHPNEFPFDPLPLLTNSRFGIALHNQQGNVQPMLFAPVMGGVGSKMENGSQYKFEMYLVNEQASSINKTFENIARNTYGFRDYRQNEIASLNTTLYNIIDYSLSDYAWFVDKLKGSAYSTDVPGAVKNVTSLNALELAIVTDNKQMFETRAYPTMEYMLSREKFLFSLDPEQKIQSPSRNLYGPIAPISELTSLYNIFGKVNPFLIKLAKQEFNSSRKRNLEVEDQGNTWYNALWLYKSTEDKAYLERAITGADTYLKERVNKSAKEFSSDGSSFFWTGFTPKFVELLELYEVTNERKYLDAAQQAARQYTMFTWMSPKIPEQDVLVNKGGLAPLYWYLESKGHEQMFAAEEVVTPWKLSEIGLTPESSGTSSGHRAIFMANYAPWMLRIGHYSDDNFLKEVAKAAIIGRYSNFPGYHINTARTTVYEKPDYPLRKHKELSVNSFHYNHILPKASMLLDYLVTDTFARSNGEISFPSEYIEGYAYLQNKYYGHKPGQFYDEKDVNLWMPKGLLSIDNVELNYIAGYRGDELFIALVNQSQQTVNTTVTIDPTKVNLQPTVTVKTWQENKLIAHRSISNNQLPVKVNANGITVIKLSGATAQVTLAKQLTKKTNSIENDYLEIEAGNARAMFINLASIAPRAFIYLRDDDSKVSSLFIDYIDEQGNKQTLSDDSFPFELTIELPKKATAFSFNMQVNTVGNTLLKVDNLSLGVISPNTIAK